MQYEFKIEGRNQTREFLNLAIYIVSFFVTWSLYVFFVQKYIGQNHLLLFSVLKIGFVKILIWTMPVLLYLKYHDKVNPLFYLKLQGNISTGLMCVIIVSCFYTLIGLVQQYITLKHIQFHVISNIDSWINVIILAGVTEEIIFRGFFLQKLGNVFSFWKANYITAFLFLLIHFPGWIYHGEFTFMNINILGIFIFGLISGYVFKKSNSLGACMLIHAINNFISLSFQ